MTALLRSRAKEIDADAWRDSTVEACAEMVSTGPFGSLLHKWDYIEGGVPVINPVNLVEGEIRCDERVTVTPEKAGELCAYRVQSGDILVARRGDIGRCAVVQPSNDGWLCGTGCFFIRPNQGTEPRFLAMLLGSPEYQERLQAASTGATMPNLSNKTLSKLAIRTPSLDEQKRIVAVLDQAFAALDRARALAEANLADAGGLFDGWLTAVFHGHPSSWRTEKLRSLCHQVTVGHVGPMAERYVESGVPFLRSQNVRPFEINLVDVKFVDDGFHEELKKSALVPGDVAIVRTGYPGTAAVIPQSLPVANCADLVIVRPKDVISSEFLVMFLNSSFGKSMVAEKAVGAAQKHFNVGAAKEVDFSFPPIAEQENLVAQAKRMRSRTGQLESTYQAKLAALATLRQSLLQKAFAGELA